MEGSALGEIEELTLCSCCRRPFDEHERPPKLLACKHHFCLACARTVLAGAGREVHCVHCWKRTEPPGGRADRLPTHGAVLALARRLALPSPAPATTPPALWCCAPHAPALRPPAEPLALLAAECRHLRADLHRLAARHRADLLRALHAATALKLRLEADLAAPGPAASEPADLPAAAAARDDLRARHRAALLQARLDDLVRAADGPLDADLVRRALAADPAPPSPPSPPSPSAAGQRDPVLLLANYCTTRLYLREGAALQERVERVGRNPAPYPLYYFELEVNGAPQGRVVVEVRSDVAPRMARNFDALARGEAGGCAGYRGCAVFQCWESESVITGDWELNNGRGGRAALEGGAFLPDETRLAAVRGAVGMRRSQRRHDNLGLVASQFRIVLREMRGFTAIFALVVEGLDLVDRLSRTGDSAGKPHSTILISGCGRID